MKKLTFILILLILLACKKQKEIIHIQNIRYIEYIGDDGKTPQAKKINLNFQENRCVELNIIFEKVIKLTEISIRIECINKNMIPNSFSILTVTKINDYYHIHLDNNYIGIYMKS